MHWAGPPSQRLISKRACLCSKYTHKKGKYQFLCSKKKKKKIKGRKLELPPSTKQIGEAACSPRKTLPSMAGVPPPPRQLDVRRFAAARASELRSLYAAVSSRLDDAGGRHQPRSARRRTTGHLPSKRRRRGAGEVVPGDDDGLPARKQSRRVRRRRELAANPAEGFSVAGDGARRLRTHLWYAKRFSMERRWTFILPVGAQGR